MKEYLLCLDKQYNITLGASENEALFNLETMLDNAIYLLQSYKVDDDEILQTIKEDTTIKLRRIKMKKYNIVEIGNEEFVLCQSPTLRIAKKQLKEMEKTDKYLQKYYKWSRIAEYKIIETEVK